MALDTVACLAAGKCAVLTKGVLNTLFAFSALAGILLTVLIMVGFMTPALVFLKAKFNKKSLIYMVNRGQQGHFVLANNKFQGIADVKGIGPLIITEGSHTIETRSKIPFYFCFGEFASTLPLTFAKVVNYLKTSGKKINNIDDLAQLVGMEFDDEKKGWKQIEIDAKDIVKKTALESEKALVNSYETIKLHDMAYMFPFNITPALMESRTQHLIGLKMKMFNTMTPQLVMMFIMIMMGATLSAVIAFKFLQSPDQAAVGATTTIIERVVQNAPLVGNLTG